MKRLISIEFHKIWKNKANRFLIIAYFILLSFVSLFASIEFDLGSLHFRLADMGIFNFPYIWHFTTYNADFITFFLGVIIISMITNEYSYGTLKQNLIDGLSKSEFIQSKALVIALLSLAATVFIFLVTLILGLIFSSYNEASIVFSGLEYILAFFIKIFFFFSLCFFLGTLLKRSAFAMGFFVVWFIAERIMYGVMKFEIFNRAEWVDTFCGYLPLTASSNLLIEPYSRLSAIHTIGNQAGINYDKDYSVHTTTVITVIIWALLFLYFSYRIIKRRDL